MINNKLLMIIDNIKMTNGHKLSINDKLLMIINNTTLIVYLSKLR